MLALIVVRATYIINQIQVNNFAFSLVTHGKGTFALKGKAGVKRYTQYFEDVIAYYIDNTISSKVERCRATKGWTHLSDPGKKRVNFSNWGRIGKINRAREGRRKLWLKVTTSCIAYLWYNSVGLTKFRRLFSAQGPKLILMWKIIIQVFGN